MHYLLKNYDPYDDINIKTTELNLNPSSYLNNGLYHTIQVYIQDN